MDCRRIRERLGPFVDEEAATDERREVERHVAACPACANELASLRALATELAGTSETTVPDGLWSAIERRLDAEEAAATPSSRHGVPPSVATWIFRTRKTTLACAAAVLIVLGVGLFGQMLTGSKAEAATVNFQILLDALPLDAQKAFRRFLMFYDARKTSPVQAKRSAPELNFDLPDKLPGGFLLNDVFVLRFGRHAGVAASYRRNGDFIGVVFHRPVQKEDFGPHRDYPCVVGKHTGHKVSVGEWRLVHLTDPTTCHCVLSRLDEETQLPAVMAAVAPGLSTAGSSDHDH